MISHSPFKNSQIEFSSDINPDIMETLLKFLDLLESHTLQWIYSTEDMCKLFLFIQFIYTSFIHNILFKDLKSYLYLQTWVKFDAKQRDMIDILISGLCVFLFFVLFCFVWAYLGDRQYIIIIIKTRNNGLNYFLPAKINSQQ